MNMEPKEYSDETIDYIFGDMSQQERANFEEKLKSDPALAEEVTRMKEIIGEGKLGVQLDSILNDPGYEWAQKEAAKVVKEHMRKKQLAYLLSRKFRRKVVYPMAAVLLALLYIGNIIIFMANPELALQRYYKEYTPVYYAEATINEAQALLTHSLDQYSQGNYEAVADNMHALMAKGELNFQGQIMLAFYDVWNRPLFYYYNKEKTDQEDAAWYIALSSLKLNKLQQAKTYFSKLASEDSRLGKKAARMEKKVDKMLSTEQTPPP